MSSTHYGHVQSAQLLADARAALVRQEASASAQVEQQAAEAAQTLEQASSRLRGQLTAQEAQAAQVHSLGRSPAVDKLPTQNCWLVGMHGIRLCMQPGSCN